MSDPSSLAPLLRYQCSHCATTSDSRELIEVHAAALHAIRTHFSCDFCGVQMPEMADLIRHVIQTHFGNESLSYVTQGQQIRIQGSGTTAEQQVELLPLEQDFRLSPQDLDKNNTFEDCYPPPKLNIQPLDTTSSPQVAGDFKSPSPDSTEKTVTSCPSQPAAPVSEDLCSATLNTPEIVANLTPDVIVRSGSSQSLIPGMSGGARILGTAPLTSSFSSSGGKGIAVLGLAAKSGTLSSGLATNPPINDINNNNTKSFQLVLPRGCSVLSKGQVQRLLTDGGGVGLLQASKPAKASLFQTFKSEPVPALQSAAVTPSSSSSSGPKIPAPFLCPTPGCVKTFQSKKNLNQHVQRVHNKEARAKRPCPYPECTHGAQYEHQLRAHVNKVHKKAFEYKCFFCVCKFAYVDARLTHMNMEHGDLYREYMAMEEEQQLQQQQQQQLEQQQLQLEQQQQQLEQQQLQLEQQQLLHNSASDSTTNNPA